jgi:hypothetical protein
MAAHQSNVSPTSSPAHATGIGTSTTCCVFEPVRCVRAATGVKNNRSLLDDNTAQTLGGVQIAQMKVNGMKGQMIVDAVVKNSSTFANKTEFAQEKYVRKKQKK